MKTVSQPIPWTDLNVPLVTAPNSDVPTQSNTDSKVDGGPIHSN